MKTPLALAITAAALALSTAATAQEPQSGGTIDTIIQPEPPGLVLGMIQNAPTRTVAGNIYEGLPLHHGFRTHAAVGRVVGGQ